MEETENEQQRMQLALPHHVTEAEAEHLIVLQDQDQDQDQLKPPPPQSGTSRKRDHSGLGADPSRQRARLPGSMSADVSVSVSVLVGVVVLSDVTRRVLVRVLGDTGVSVYAAELVSTFQLCCCAHELKLLSDSGGVPPQLGLSLTYLASVVHGLTFRGALGNPSSVLEHAYRERLSRGCALRRIACQFAAAAAARALVPAVWGLGLSGLHLQYRCGSTARTSLSGAAAVELGCAFTVQTVITHTQAVDEKYRVHAVAAAITTVVYAGNARLPPNGSKN